MRSEKEIRERLNKSGSAFEIETLLWVLDSKDCPMCDMNTVRELEIEINAKNITPEYLEEKYGWQVGTVLHHMDEHIDFDANEARYVEQMRSESIDTLDSAQSIVRKLMGWLDELESVKDREGISSEWVADATKLVAQANTSLRLVGQLKKEIGVDSQLLLAQAQMEGVMGILVNSLKEQPETLDMIELQISALKEPTYVIDG